MPPPVCARRCEPLHSKLMETHTSANDWTALLSQWQAMSQHWSNYWSHGESSPMPVAPPSLELGNAALAVLAPTEAWFDPAAVAELTERYNRRFEALWQRAIAGSNVSPTAAGAHAAVPDRRFGAKEWREHPYFTWLKDAYLLYADYVRELAALAQGDPGSRKRVRFLARQYTDAIAPSNFLATNPEALKLAVESRGASVARGLANLIDDARRGTTLKSLSPGCCTARRTSCPSRGRSRSSTSRRTSPPGRSSSPAASPLPTAVTSMP